jgi:hypothetical protein
MKDRIEKELILLRKYFPNLEYREDGHWFRVPNYALPEGWNRESTDVAFQLPQAGFPGVPPYGIYAPSGLTFKGEKPENYTEPAPSQPPFGDNWGVFSWEPHPGEWRATSDLQSGSNLLNWVMGFKERFKEGK